MKASELMNQWIENSRTAFGPMNELNEITKRAVERLSAQQMNVIREYMDLGARSVQFVASTKDPRELVNGQVTLAKEFGDKLLADAETYTKLAMEAQADVAKWAESTTEAAVAKVGEAASNAA